MLVFLPKASFGLRVLSLPASVCVNHELVRAIAHHPFQLESSNLDHRCKIPWLRSLLFLGVIDLDLQGQIKLQSQNLPHFELFRAITHHPFKLGTPKCQIQLIFKILFICIAFVSWKYLWDLYKRMKKESVPHPKWVCTNMFAHSVVSWTVEQSICIFSVTIVGFPVLDSAIGKGFLMLL